MMAAMLLLNCLVILSSICSYIEACPPPDFHGYPYDTMTISPNLPVYTPGDAITYKCLYCFEPESGDFSRQCKNDGTWTGTPPSCKERPSSSFHHDANQPNITQYYRSVSQTGGDQRQASLAIDGSLRTYTTVFKGPDDVRSNVPEWRLDLCTALPVSGIRICNGQQGDTGELDILHANQKWCNLAIFADDVECGEITPDHCIEPGKCFIMFCIDMPTEKPKRSVQISSTDGSSFNLAEVEVFADINSQFYNTQQYSVGGQKTNPLIQFQPLK